MDAFNRPGPGRPAATVRRCGRALLVTAMLCASPAVARAQNPFAPLPSQPAPAPTVTAPAPSTPSGSSGGLSTAEQVGLFGVGVLLIAGIGFMIRRDARARAPGKRTVAIGPRATTRPRDKRVAKSRARAKAARRQRKRTR